MFLQGWTIFRLFIAAFVIVCLGLPSVSFGNTLRVTQEGAQRTGLEERLGLSATAGKRIAIHLDPQIVEGRLVGTPDPYLTTGVIHPDFWKEYSVRSAFVIALAGVTTANQNGKAGFSLKRNRYATTRPYIADQSLSLLVEVDGPSQIPKAAYDMKTGEQVYPDSNQIAVYLDPRIRDGRLVEGSLPYRVFAQVGSPLWKEARVNSSSVIALAGVNSSNHAGKAAFSFQRTRYTTTHPYSADHPIRLLLVVDVESRLPTAAYDLETGAQVYVDSNQIAVYLDPQIKDGRLVGVSPAYRVVGQIKPDFWKEPSVQSASAVALAGIRTFDNKGKTSFSYASRKYITTRSYDPVHPLRLLMVVDVARRRPMAAYDQTTGEAVYLDSSRIAVYLNPRIEKGQLVENPSPYRVTGLILLDFWEEPSVHSASLIALAGVNTSKRDRKTSFSFRGNQYVTTRSYDVEHPLRLLVEVDGVSQLPRAAYDLATGAQVYPAEETSEQLKPLADMAAGGDQAWVVEDETRQSGMEEDQIEVRLDPRVEGRTLVDRGEFFLSVQSISPVIWGQLAMMQAKQVAFENLTTYDVNGTAVFRLDGKIYHTTEKFNPSEELRLVLVADPKTRLPVSAYDLQSGKEVFSAADQVQVFLNPEIQNGRIVGKPDPLRFYGKVPPEFWDENEVQRAQTVVMQGVTTMNRGDGIAVFSLFNHRHVTDQPYDENAPLRLLVVVEPTSKTLIAAYDVKSGKQVYEAGNAISIYLDPPLESNGRIIGNPVPYRVVRVVKAATWDHPDVSAANRVVLTHVPVRGQNGNLAVFSLAQTRYVLTRRLVPNEPLQLRVVVDPKQKTPLAVYDMKTDELIEFRAQTSKDRPRIEVYLNPRIESGKLVGGQEPFHAAGNLASTLWQKQEIQQAERVGLLHVATFAGKRNTAIFKIAGQAYSTSRQFDSAARLFLLVLVDPKTRIPIVAYDQESGEQVHPGSDWIRVYVNPKIESGRLVAEQKPSHVVQVLQSQLFEQLQGGEAAEIALEGVVTSQKGNTASFSLLNQSYMTTRSFDPADPLKLLVIVDARSRLPKAAYDSSGQLVFSETDQMAVYLNPKIEAGRLDPGSIAHAVMPQFRTSLWNDSRVKGAKTLAVSNIAGGDHQGAAVFNTGGRMYRIGRVYDPLKPFRVLAVFDVASQSVTVAYDMQTGERIFSAQEDLIHVYTDPVIENGRLAGDSLPVESVVLATHHLWDRSEINQANSIALDNVTTSLRYKHAQFRLFGQSYQTTRSFEPNDPLCLLIVVDVGSKLPIAAYDRKTGEQVFSASEVIRVHVDPAVEEGHIAGDSKPVRLSLIIDPSAWKGPAFDGASTIVLENVPTNDRNGTASFSYSKRNFNTSRSFDPQHLLRLLLVIDAETKAPLVAYDQETGEEVYPATGEVRIFLDPALQNGRLPDDAKPFRRVQKIDVNLWSFDAVRNSTRLVVADVATSPIKSATSRNITAVFRFDSGYYVTSRLYDSENPMNILVEVDVGTRVVLAAYDMASGERVYHSSDEVSVYLDPIVTNGRLTGNPAPFSVGRFSRFVLNQAVQRNPKHIVLQNVPAVNQGGLFGFRVLAESYQTRRSFVAESPLLLLVVVDPLNGIPVAAYDQQTAEEVYSIKDQIHVYLDPPLEAGRLAGERSPFRVVKVVQGSFWDTLEVQQAKIVVFGNAQAVLMNDGFEVFRLAGRTYRTGRRYDSGSPARIEILADPKKKLPVSAHDEQSGEKIYPPADQVRAYLDASIESGRIVGDPEPFWRGQQVLPALWNRAEVQRAQAVVFANVGTHPTAERKVVFSMGGKLYRTTRQYESERPLTLLVSVDPRSKVPSVAYDFKTGEKVYPLPMIPVQESLKSLAEMASHGDQAWVVGDESGDEQAGLEEREIYLDPRIQDGQLEPGQSPYWRGKKLGRHFWDKEKVRQSQVVAIANLKTEKAHNSNSAVFSMRSVKYALERAFNAAQPEKLLVVMGLQPNSPVEAYLMGSGEKVYALGADDLIRIYLDPPMTNGKFIGQPEPFLLGRVVPPSLWRDPKVVVAKEVVVDGVATFNLSNGKTGFHSGPGGRNYSTSRNFDSAHPMKLRVVIDRASGLPFSAFEAVTGEQVYPAGEQISVYLDPVIEEGRLTSFSRLFFRAEIVRANVWQSLRKATTQSVALSGIPTYQRQMMAVFSIGGKKFETTRIYEQDRPLRLLVIIEPGTLIPSAAYDLATGEQVYNSQGLIGVHLNPEIRDGKLVDPGKPSQRVAYLSAAFWDRTEVQAASTVAMQDVEAISVAGGKSRPRYGFTLRNTKYRTERPFQAAVPLKLLVVVNPRTQKPLAAYDQTTGGKIYDAQKLVQVYLNPTVDDGRLVSPGTPYTSTGMVQSGLWKELALKAPFVALSGIRGFHQRGVLTFHIGDTAYRTYFPLQKGSHADLLVIARTADKTPTEAYVLKTGQKIYPTSESEISATLQPLAALAKSDSDWVVEQDSPKSGLEEGNIEVLLNPRIEGSQLLDRGEPFLSVQTISSVLWPQLDIMGAKQVAFVGVPVYKAGKEKTRFRFRVGRQNYSFSRDFPEAEKLMKLIAIANVDSRQVLAAFDEETGEMVYPLMGQVFIYLDPSIEQGKVVGNPTPYSVVQKLPVKLWSDPQVLTANILALDNIPARFNGGIGIFKIQGREYSLSGSSSDSAYSVGLLVLINPKTGQVQAAYDRETGNLVYSETDLVKIYFDPVIKDGKLVPGQSSVAQMKQVQGLWELPEVGKANTIVLEGAKAQQKREGGGAVFWLSGREYSTTLRLELKQQVPLLVVIDVKSRKPTVAYELTSGRTVFDATQIIQVYLDPVIREGHLVGAPEPYDQMATISLGFWDRAPVRSSQVVVFDNVNTYRHSAKTSAAGFHLFGDFYRTNRSFDDSRPFRVLVLVDGETHSPTAAFDAATGEQVYPNEEDIGIYLDPVLNEGRIPSNVLPHKTTGRIQPGFWNSAEIESAKLIGLAPVTARRRMEMDGPDVAIFAFGNRYYPTGRRFDEASPLQLLLLVDPRTISVLAAYDLKTGEQVYSDQQIIRVHVDPVVEDGKIVKPGTYVKEVIRIQTGHLFKEPKIRDAREWIAFEGVPTYSSNGNLAFHLFGETFWTSRSYDEHSPGKLLVLARPNIRVPAKAFNLSTGEEVFSSEDWLRVYLDPEVANGRLMGAPKPFTIVQKLRAPLWRNAQVKKATTIVVASMGTTQPRRTSRARYFTIGKELFKTSLSADLGDLARLLVRINSKNRRPLAAYNMATGEQVYPTEEADPQLQPIENMASEGSEAWVAEEDQAGPSTELMTGLEEVAAEVVEGWVEGREGQGLMVVSPEVLNGSAGTMIRQTVARLPVEVANRIVLPIYSASAEDVAMTLLERDPLPDRVWVVGSFGSAFSGMLRGFTNVTELAPGSGLEEFLAQVGLMLGVPVNEIESGLEEIRNAEGLSAGA